MTHRLFRLTVEMNGKKSSCDCSILIDIYTSSIRKTRYDTFSTDIPKWIKEIVGDYEFQRLKDKIDDIAQDLYNGRDGMEITIKL